MCLIKILNFFHSSAFPAYVIIVSFYFYSLEYEEEQEYFEHLSNFYFRVIQKISFEKMSKVLWLDIWEIDTKISKLEELHETPWNMYYMYKLSMINTWHVLEDRITLFVVILIYCL